MKKKLCGIQNKNRRDANLIFAHGFFRRVFRTHFQRNTILLRDEKQTDTLLRT